MEMIWATVVVAVALVLVMQLAVLPNKSAIVDSGTSARPIEESRRRLAAFEAMRRDAVKHQREQEEQSDGA